MGTSRSGVKRVVGLRYEDAVSHAPTISIKGVAFEADEVLKIAARFGIPVVERAELVKGLDHLDEDEEIPEQLYEAVALLLGDLERINK